MQFCYTFILFYPTIAALFDKNRPAVYTITIYGRLYMAELNIAKMQMAAIFFSRLRCLAAVTKLMCHYGLDMYTSLQLALYTQVYKDRDQIFSIYDCLM